jgi:HrpA-like RNA helicase
MPIPKKIEPIPVRKALETETPFDLVLLMSKYGLKFSGLEFMSKVDFREVAFAENWLIEIGAIDRRSHEITQKGVLMSEIPYEPDFAHMISGALMAGDYNMARFLLASGAFGDSLNHAYRTDMEGVARDFLYTFDMSNELNIKAHLLRGYSEDKKGTFASWLAANGIFLGFVEEAWKNFESAREALNDLLVSSAKPSVPKEVLADPDLFKLRTYLEDCLSFEKFDLHEKNEHNLRHMVIEGQFFARTLTINSRRILFDIVAMNPSRKHARRRKR